ncbi:MAG: glycosyl transferase [Leptolyngbya foveolarum]|uniref:4,4'-diaponeurosporenoate glycosyltransferase n=1 Tax=Leptolyngbya foveolarum TaxID=47253 RepID=A0A2W4UHK0_9CYAN|nr:MAG: glycosyl transferase [Leptolyngbya foveolarum]
MYSSKIATSADLSVIPNSTQAPPVGLQPFQDQPIRMRLPSDSSQLKGSKLPSLTSTPPLSDCRVSVIIPVRNEADSLPAVIKALAHQVDGQGRALDPNSYEVLVLANNCTDSTVETVERLGDRYPRLQLQVIEVSIPRKIAHVGKARQMVMDEAYRRFSLIGLKDRIIASTDGDTEVAANWISSLIEAFDKGIDALGGRIITRRADTPGISKDISLYYLRRLAHAYFVAQIECCLDPQAHDCWPRHFQYCGANMAVSAEMYGKVGGMPLVRHEEDVALYRRLQRADAKIRHSLDVRVLTSARQIGRATGGLSELLETLSHVSQARQQVLVELPEITEARIIVRRHLRQVRSAIKEEQFFNVKQYARTADLLAKSLGLPTDQLRQAIENAPTFGELIATLCAYQAEQTQPIIEATTEISIANMHLRQRLRQVRQSCITLTPQTHWVSPHILLKALQQVQTIPLIVPTYQ